MKHLEIIRNLDQVKILRKNIKRKEAAIDVLKEECSDMEDSIYVLKSVTDVIDGIPMNIKESKVQRRKYATIRNVTDFLNRKKDFEFDRTASICPVLDEPGFWELKLCQSFKDGKGRPEVNYPMFYKTYKKTYDLGIEWVTKGLILVKDDS